MLDFVVAINEADADRLAALMTEDRVFVDSDGSELMGRETVRKAWSEYFSLMPDYRMHVEETYWSGHKAVLIGVATGPGMASRWSVPAAWRAVVAGDRVAAWQLFVNPEPILAAMRGRA